MESIDKLSPNNKALIGKFLRFLCNVSLNTTTKMTVHNLAVSSCCAMYCYFVQFRFDKQDMCGILVNKEARKQ